MITVSLSEELEAAVTAAADRKGMSLDDYLAVVCTEALSLEVDRARVQSYLSGSAPGVSQARAEEWLSDLAAGKRGACPR